MLGLSESLLVSFVLLLALLPFLSFLICFSARFAVVRGSICLSISVYAFSLLQVDSSLFGSVSAVEDCRLLISRSITSSTATIFILGRGKVGQTCENSVKDNSLNPIKSLSTLIKIKGESLGRTLGANIEINFISSLYHQYSNTVLTNMTDNSQRPGYAFVQSRISQLDIKQLQSGKNNNQHVAKDNTKFRVSLVLGSLLPKLQTMFNGNIKVLKETLECALINADVEFFDDNGDKVADKDKKSFIHKYVKNRVNPQEAKRKRKEEKEKKAAAYPKSRVDGVAPMPRLCSHLSIGFCQFQCRCLRKCCLSIMILLYTNYTTIIIRSLLSF